MRPFAEGIFFDTGALKERPVETLSSAAILLNVFLLGPKPILRREKFGNTMEVT